MVIARHREFGMRRLLALAVAALLLGTAAPAFAFGTTPDPSYGTAGVVSYPNGVSEVWLMQAGTSTYVAYSTLNGALVVERRDQTGGLTSQFSTADATGAVYGATAAADGSVYLLFVPFNAAATWRIMRVASDGTQDLSFGPGGSAQTRMSVADSPRAMAADAAGRVYVAGDRDPQRATPTAFVLRLSATGRLDRSFDTDGRRNFHDLANSSAAGLAVGAHAVVVVGSQGRNGFAARLRAGGALDPRFGRNGYAFIHAKVGAVVMTSVVLTPQLRVAGRVHQRKPRQDWLIAGPLFGRYHRLALCPRCQLTTSPVIASDGSVVGTAVRPRPGHDRTLLVGMLASGGPDPGIAATGYAAIGPVDQGKPLSVAVDGSAVLVSSRPAGTTTGATVTRYVPGP